MEQKDSALFGAVAYSYASFIEDYLTLVAHPSYASCSYIDDEMAMICKEMQTLFLSIPNLLGAEGDFKETYVKKLITFREILENKYRLLTSYKRELGHISSLYNLENSLSASTFEDFGLTAEDAAEIDFSMLAKDCTQFVFKASEAAERQERASLLLPYIPMRMTKSNFLTYVRKALDKIYIEDSASSASLLLSILGQQFDGTWYGPYGSDFSDIHLTLEALKTPEDEESFFADVDMLDEMLNHLLEMIALLYHMICTFSNLLIFDELTFNVLTEMHVSFYDLYYSLQSILTGAEDKEIFMETLAERLPAIKEELENAYEKALTKAQDDPLLILAHTHLKLSIHQVFGFDAHPHEPFGETVATLLDNFVTRLEEALTALSPKERKLRMQYFMSVLPFMMNDQSFYTYVLQGFSGTSDLRRNLFTSMYLANVLEQNEFYNENSEDVHAPTLFEELPYASDVADTFLENHSTHSSDCACGHDHAHNSHHSCSCNDKAGHGQCSCGHSH